MTDVTGDDSLRHDVASRLGAAVGRIARLTRPSRGELSAGHFSTLATIVRHGPQRPSDLARAERVAASTMTRIISVLERRHLVERRQTPTDARSVTVAITPEGRRLLDEARTDRSTSVAELLQVLDDGQLARVAEALELLELVAAEALESSSTSIRTRQAHAWPG